MISVVAAFCAPATQKTVTILTINYLLMFAMDPIDDRDIEELENSSDEQHEKRLKEDSTNHC